MSGKQVNVELSRLWKELPSEQKVVFEQKARSEKERVQSEKELKTVEEVKQPPPPAKKAQASSKQKTVQEEKPKKTVAEPPPKNKEVKKEQNSAGFKYFCEEQMEDLQSEHPSWNGKKIESELKKMWQSLNKEDRESYDLEATEEQSVQESEEELDD